MRTAQNREKQIENKTQNETKDETEDEFITIGTVFLRLKKYSFGLRIRDFFERV